MAPDLPENFIQRPDEFGRLKDLLLGSDRKASVAITTALAGAGGFGKTTLATALCHDEDIIQNFDDGILWVAMGENPNILNSLVTVYAAFTGERPGFADAQDAAFQLGQKLEDRNCLLVIDDVWDDAHLRPFRRGGKGCGRLFTTRNAEIAANAPSVNVHEMRESESVAMLTKGVPGLQASKARYLSQRLASLDNTVKVWYLKGEVEARNPADHRGAVTSVVVTADGRHAVSADKTPKFWDLDGHAEPRTLAGHSGPVTALALSADGRRAVAASLDNTLKVWDVDSGMELRTLVSCYSGASCVALSADGRRVLSASWDDTLTICDVESGVELCTLATNDSFNFSNLRGHWASRVALSADGRFAVTASGDQTLKLWKLPGGVIATFTYDAPVICCAVADTCTVVAGDDAGRIHLLSLELR